MFEKILRECKQRYKPFTKKVSRSREPKSFEEAILRAEGNAIIAEIKFSSPRGRIRAYEPPAKLAKLMQAGGACAISVLTEEKYFSGSLSYLHEVAKAVDIPVLRKDFIFHPSQIDEAYYYGADGVLLIASFFSAEELGELIDRCREFGIQPLVEVHSFQDIARAEETGAQIYVINNRDKDTLEISLRRSEELSQSIKGLKISASGISSPRDLKYVLKYCDAALIGTAIMKSQDVKKAVERFVHA